MNDEIIPAGSDPEAERLARVAAVEQKRLADDAEAERKREYNRIKKQEQRAREKAAREQTAEFQKSLVKENEDVVTARQTLERQNRSRLIASELKPPIQPDEPIEGTGESYWKWFQGELEIFIDEVRRFSCGSWESFYFWMSETTAGRRVLEFYGIPPLDMPKTNDDKFYLTLVHQSEGPPVPTFTNLTPEEQQIIHGLKQLWDANRAAKKDWKP